MRHEIATAPLSAPRNDSLGVFMTWASWTDFFAMGGYGLYVWGSYGVTLALITLEVLSLRRRKRVAIEDLRRLRGAAQGGGR